MQSGEGFQDVLHETMQHVMPGLNTSSERSIIAQSSERPWHLCMVTANAKINGNCFLNLFHDHELAF